MPMRNPFRRQAPPQGLDSLKNLNGRIDSSLDGSDGGSTMGSTNPSSVSLSSGRNEPGEYKLSTIDGSGIYHPPSPTQEKPKTPTWLTSPRLNSSSRQNSHSKRPSLTDEPFSNISRESFDSYRRSFDISARSPITHHFTTTKPPSPPRSYSFDVGRQANGSASPFVSPIKARPQRASLRDPPSFVAPPEQTVTEEDEEEDDDGSAHASSKEQAAQDAEIFEDVVLGEDNGTTGSKRPARRGIFSRFGGTSSATNAARPGSSGKEGSGLGIWHGRKRGHSGQGAELGAIAQPVAVTGKENERPAAAVKQNGGAAVEG